MSPHRKSGFQTPEHVLLELFVDLCPTLNSSLWAFHRSWSLNQEQVFSFNSDTKLPWKEMLLTEKFDRKSIFVLQTTKGGQRSFKPDWVRNRTIAIILYGGVFYFMSSWGWGEISYHLFRQIPPSTICAFLSSWQPWVLLDPVQVPAKVCSSSF